MNAQENEMNDKTASDIWQEWAEKVEAHGDGLSDVLWEFLEADSFDYHEYEEKGLDTIDGAGVTADFEEFLAENYGKPPKTKSKVPREFAIRHIQERLAQDNVNNKILADILSAIQDKPYIVDDDSEYEAMVVAIDSAVKDQVGFVPSLSAEYGELVHKLATFCLQHKKPIHTPTQDDKYANMGIAEMQAEYAQMAQ